MASRRLQVILTLRKDTKIADDQLHLPAVIMVITRTINAHVASSSGGKHVQQLRIPQATNAMHMTGSNVIPVGTPVTKAPSMEEIDAAQVALKQLSQSENMQALLRGTALLSSTNRPDTNVKVEESSSNSLLQPGQSTMSSASNSVVQSSFVPKNTTERPSEATPVHMPMPAPAPIPIPFSFMTESTSSIPQDNSQQAHTNIARHPTPSGPRAMRRTTSLGSPRPASTGLIHGTSASSSFGTPVASSYKSIGQNLPPPLPSTKEPRNTAASGSGSGVNIGSAAAASNSNVTAGKESSTNHPPPTSSQSSSSRPGHHASQMSSLNRELWDVRRQVTALKARENTIMGQIRELSPGEILDDSNDHGKDGTGGGNGGDLEKKYGEKVKKLEEEVESLRRELSREYERRKDAEADVEVERRRRIHAEDVLQDARREYNAPLIVPAMMEAFQRIGELTTNAILAVGDDDGVIVESVNEKGRGFNNGKRAWNY
ncbi:hypothetical protein ABKN59_004844 [Abortiporus biennis]